MKTDDSLTFCNILQIALLLVIAGCSNGNDCPSLNLDNIDEDTILNMDTADNDDRVKNPITVIWSGDKKVLQIYSGGILIFPTNNPHQKHCPGISQQLDPGYYEFKLWSDEGSIIRSVWIFVDD